MLKAIFLDMDETLCDTTSANIMARENLKSSVKKYFSSEEAASNFATDYLKGIYKDLTPYLKSRLMPIVDEETFRTNLIIELFKIHQSSQSISLDEAHLHRQQFDDYRLLKFDFFPGVLELLAQLRTNYTLTVITNGPIYSQHPKVHKIDLKRHVDHIIIGGEEPEEKPAVSIFHKALQLSQCMAEQTIHVGDSLSADIVGGNNAGLKTVWINPQGTHNQIASHTIKNLIDLPQVLQLYSR
jgi:N-acylneuraminate-9-phosphatase